MNNNLDDRIRELQQMPTGDLKTEWIRIFGQPPRSGNVAWMRKRLIYQEQVRLFGDLSPAAKERLEELLVYAPQWLPMGRKSLPNRIGETLAPVAPPRASSAPEPGSVITRPYKGRTIVVTVREDGFECDGAIYSSLSAVAKAVTGSHWNGPLFFFGPAREKRTA